MPVWWGTFAYMMIVSAIGMYMYKSKQATAALVPVEGEKTEQYKSIGLAMALLSFALLVFFAGNRSGIHDTPEYQYMYELFYTDDLNQITDIINGNNKTKGPLFFIYLILFKHFTHGTFNDWLMSIAIFQAVSLAVFFYKYSVNYVYSVYLFYTMSIFLWMVNGMRQFIAITIILFAVDWLIQKKTVPFMIVVLIAYNFHSSAILWVPVYFMIHFKPWSAKFLICAALLTFAIIFVSNSSLLNNTDYDYIATSNRSGINPFRLAVSMVIPVIAYTRKDIIEEKNDPLVNLLINISVISVGCYVVGMFTNGVAARIAAYFDIFSLILLPWLLKKAFDESMGRTIAIVSFIGYFVFFWYTMYGAKNGMYVSQNLGLYYWTV